MVLAFKNGDFKLNRRDFSYNYFSAASLFITGILIMPALLFNPSTELRIAQFLFFLLLAFLSGNKINPFITIFFIIFITAFNLLIPYGRVLYSIGAFKITSGALTAGIHRAVTLAALVMLSKAAIRQDLKLPGAFGSLLSDSMRMFSALMNKKHRLINKNPIETLDNLLLELSTAEIAPPQDNTIKTKPLGYVVLVAVIILSWVPWVFIKI